MRASISLLVLLILSSTIFAQQRQTFDIASFIPPEGWQNETKDFATSYVTTNNLTGGWCRATLYKNFRSSGNSVTDFNNEWQNLIAKSFPETALPTPEATTEDGWTSQAGAAKIQFNNQDAASLLTTVTGYGVTVSIVVLMNSEEFMPAIESFLASIDLQKPRTVQNQSAPTNPVQNQPAQPHQPLSNNPSNSGISVSTTNFDDGWVAQPFADYVKVTKEQTVVLLHFGIEITDAMRDTNDVAGALWNQVIAPRYTLNNVRKYDNDGPCYFCIYFFEADAIDHSTGKNCYVGFRVITNAGIAKCIEIIAPSAQEFQRLFPDQKKVESMLNYNKFAIAEKDLIGEWAESSGAYANMYNVNTGAYAGMNTSSSANKFIFKPKGQYESTHSGAYGMVGSMQFYNQKYNGQGTYTFWDMTLTKRFKDKTEIFWAQFEAVKGGRVLHLTNKEAAGVSYHLVKAK